VKTIIIASRPREKANGGSSGIGETGALRLKRWKNENYIYLQVSRLISSSSKNRNQTFRHL
jgi:hypothetical protein